MVVTIYDPELADYEKRYKDRILYDSNDSDGGFFLGLKESLLTQNKRVQQKATGFGSDLSKS